MKPNIRFPFVSLTSLNLKSIWQKFIKIQGLTFIFLCLRVKATRLNKTKKCNLGWIATSGSHLEWPRVIFPSARDNLRRGTPQFMRAMLRNWVAGKGKICLILTCCSTLRIAMLVGWLVYLQEGLRSGSPGRHEVSSATPSDMVAVCLVKWVLNPITSIWYLILFWLWKNEWQIPDIDYSNN